MDTLLGMWILKSWTLTTETNEKVYPFGENPEGALIYLPNGYMSVHLSEHDRTKFNSDDISQATADEFETIMQTYYSYYGRYEVHADCVIHFIESCINPNWNGITKTRYYQINNDRLTLTHSHGYKGEDVGSELIWQKN